MNTQCRPPAALPKVDARRMAVGVSIDACTGDDPAVCVRALRHGRLGSRVCRNSRWVLPERIGSRSSTAITGIPTWCPTKKLRG